MSNKYYGHPLGPTGRGRGRTLQARLRSVGLGFMVGTICVIGVRVLSNTAASLVKAYKNEFIVLCISAAAILLPSSLTWFSRYLRAWKAGLSSLLMVIAASITPFVLSYGHTHAIWTITGTAMAFVAVTSIELWLPKLRPHTAVLELNIPLQKARGPSEMLWKAVLSDDPITDWSNDLLGRAGVVEWLANHVRQRAPIIALRADLGDGKTSVLNLFRSAVKGRAIVVSFSAWLPGSETTLAHDLFNDIAAECRKYIFLPQLRKQALLFAKAISGSVGYLSGLKELIPIRSQNDDIQELRTVLSRLPLSVIVLLDEIDRMQREELLVLLKILRGAPSLPNVTFVCAFSDAEIKGILDKPSEYLEKFFPVSIELSPPDPDIVGGCLQSKLRQLLGEQRWFRDGSDEQNFANELQELWTGTLNRVCTNLRKAGLLLNDISAVSASVAGEINPLDFVAIQALARFYPQVYQRVRSGPSYLAPVQRTELFSEQVDDETYFDSLNADIKQSGDPEAAGQLLTLLFPVYERASAGKFRSRRTYGQDLAKEERRICSSDYFHIYFRFAVPDKIFSNAELSRFLSDLKRTMTEQETKAVYRTMLETIPAGHPKRLDFLWSLARRCLELNSETAQHLAYALAEHASEYTYSWFNDGEAAPALNAVFTIAQKFSASATVQCVLVEAIKRASHDTFALRLLSFTEERDRNGILTDFSHVDVTELKEAFVTRMQEKYVIGDSIDPDITQADWFALARWSKNSDRDRSLQQEFWRRFIGNSQKRLAQVINVIYPAGVVWDRDPKEAVNHLFPITEMQHLLESAPNDGDLDEAEAQGLQRMREMLQGRFNRVGKTLNA